MIKHYVRKMTPGPVIRVYHWFLSHLAAFVYGYPSEKMIVIGVTGTLGKSITTEWIGGVLESTGAKVGWATTNSFKVAGKEWANATKMTMIGRFQLQKMLRDMVKAGCKYAVIETTSQGIVQYRHLGINYDIAVLTNLSPEHIEAHGSFENYMKAKGKLFDHTAHGKRKMIDGQKIKKVKVIHTDFEYAPFFLSFITDETYAYCVQDVVSTSSDTSGMKLDLCRMIAQLKKYTSEGSDFVVNNQRFHLNPIGKFNVYNVLGAIAVCTALGLEMSEIAKGVEKLKGVPGRLEKIDEGQPFEVIVDFAYEPTSLGALFEAVRFFDHAQIIHVTGSTGGGRDKARRPVLGKMSAEFASVTIVTNEDPYDDDPQEIIGQVAAGAIEAGAKEGDSLFKILDREKAIEKAISLANPGDIVLITGKGSEPVMAVKHGKTVPWDDREAARKAIKKSLAK